MNARIELIGRLRLVGPHESVDAAELGGTRARAALAFLVLHRDVDVDTERLATVLWEGERPSTWFAGLRNTLTRVRRGLQTAGIEGVRLDSREGHVRLGLTDDVVVDIDEAQPLLERAERALVAGDHATADRLAAVLVELVERPLLAELDGEWLEDHRRGWDLLRAQALEVAMRAAVATRPRVAIEHAERVLAADPFREEAYRALMQAHLALGERAAALDVYRRAREQLSTELGIDPSDATEAVYHEALGAAPALEHGVTGTRSDIPIAGRSEELTRLDNWWSGVPRRSVRVAALSGEPGIGKTRLADEFATGLIAQGATVLYGRCDEGGRIPLQPFRDVAAFARHTAVPPWLRADSADDSVQMLDHDDPDARNRALDAVAGWLSTLANEHTAMLVIDDLHWAAPQTLITIRRLLRTQPEYGFGMLVTYRGADVTLGHPLVELLADLRRAGVLDEMPIEGLDVDAVGEIAACMCGAPQAFGAVAPLHAATGGNAFFVTEALAQLRDTGVALSDASVDGLLSPGIRHMTDARLGRLPADARRVLETAALLGHEFDVVLLARATGRALDDVLVSLDEAARAGLVSVVDDMPGRCRFAHHLVVAALADSMTPLRRVATHRNIGLALESEPEGQLVDLAWHFTEAATMGGQSRAARYARAAAQEAVRLYAYDEAVTILQRALAAGVPDAVRAEVLIDLGDAQWWADDHAGAHGTFREAEALAARAHDADAQALAALGAARPRPGATTVLSDAANVPLLQRALGALEEDEVDLRLRLSGVLALHTTDDHARQGHARRSMALADRASGGPSIAAAFDASRVALWSPRDVEDRLAFALRSLERTVLEPSARTHVALSAAGDLLQLGRRPEAEALVAEHRVAAGEHRQRRVLWELAVWDGLIAALDGDLARASGANARSLALWQDEPDGDAVVVFGLQSSVVAWWNGEAEHMLATSEAAAAIDPALGVYRSASALALHDLGRFDDAIDAVREFTAQPVCGLPATTAHVLAAVLLADACGRLGLATDAALLLEVVAPMERQWVALSGPGVDAGPADRGLGWLHLALGDHQRSAQSFASAAAIAESMGAPLWHAMARLGVARATAAADPSAAHAIVDEVTATPAASAPRVRTEIDALYATLGPAPRGH
jgi:DNA-binding SARP family transcriptional activator